MVLMLLIKTFFNLIFQIYNEGPWRVSSVQVVISWPHQVFAERAQGKWLLYPEGVPTVEGEHAGMF